MTIQKLAGYIDLTLLKPDAVKDDFFKLFADAKKYSFASICIPPSYISLAVIPSLICQNKVLIYRMLI